jgi:hypothetical protein
MEEVKRLSSMAIKIEYHARVLKVTAARRGELSFSMMA